MNQKQIDALLRALLIIVADMNYSSDIRRVAKSLFNLITKQRFSAPDIEA